MNARPKPPRDFDENPPLDAAFFAHAKPAAPGEVARLKAALEKIITAHDAGKSLDRAIADAKATLHAAE
jgi:hypothetical protein